MLPLPAWQWYPNVVDVTDKPGTVLYAAMPCSMWGHGGQFSDMMGMAHVTGDNATLYCDRSVHVRDGNYVNFDPTANGLTGPVVRYQIVHVDDQRNRGVRFQCVLRKTGVNAP